MDKNPNDIIIQILNIINYQEDKEEFAKKFVDLCIKKSLVDILSALPAEKQQQLKNEVGGKKELQEFADIIKKYVSVQDAKDSLQKGSDETLEDYLNTIMPVLSVLQKQELESYLSSLKK